MKRMLAERELVETTQGELRRARERAYDLGKQLVALGECVAEAVSGADAERSSLRLAPLVMAGMVASYELAIVVGKLTVLGTLARDLWRRGTRAGARAGRSAASVPRPANAFLTASSARSSMMTSRTRCTASSRSSLSSMQVAQSARVHLALDSIGVPCAFVR